MTCDVALGIREISSRGTPRIRVDRAKIGVTHVRWDVAISRPEPDLDERRCALHRVPTESVGGKEVQLSSLKELDELAGSTYHPPPLSLNPGPKLFGIVVCTPQPAFALANA